MARYIDADKLVDKLEELQFNAPVMTPVMKIYNVIELVEDQPTADVVEITKVVEMICKIKTNIIKNVSTMIENDFSEIVKDALGERRTDND